MQTTFAPNQPIRKKKKNYCTSAGATGKEEEAKKHTLFVGFFNKP